MLSNKDKDQQRELFLTNRRAFLGAGAALASSFGMLSVMKQAEAAEAARSTLLKPKSSVLEPKEGWLGTTRIVGNIPRPNEADMGFNRAARGLISEDAREQSTLFVAKSPLSGALSGLLANISGEDIVDGSPTANKLAIPDPERMSKHIKELARFLRANAVGIGILPPYAVYSHKSPPRPALASGKATIDDATPYECDHPYAIAVLIDQDLKTTRGSNGHDGVSSSQSFMGYLTSGMIACVIASYIRNLGYSARAHHARNYGVVLPPIFVSAGLGEMARPGDVVMHPYLGYRTKGAVITTDLPLVPDQPIDCGVYDFCTVCKKCAEHCPAEAISFDDAQSEYNGYMKWVGDRDKCSEFRITNRDGSACGTCMTVCPWHNKADNWVHTVGTYVGSRSKTGAKLLRDMDDMFYGTEIVEKYKWWLEWPELWK